MDPREIGLAIGGHVHKSRGAWAKRANWCYENSSWEKTGHGVKVLKGVVGLEVKTTKGDCNDDSERGSVIVMVVGMMVLDSFPHGYTASFVPGISVLVFATSAPWTPPEPGLSPLVVYLDVVTRGFGPQPFSLPVFAMAHVSVFETTQHFAFVVACIRCGIIITALLLGISLISTQCYGKKKASTKTRAKAPAATKKKKDTDKDATSAKRKRKAKDSSGEEEEEQQPKKKKQTKTPKKLAPKKNKVAEPDKDEPPNANAGGATGDADDDDNDTPDADLRKAQRELKKKQGQWTFRIYKHFLPEVTIERREHWPQAGFHLRKHYRYGHLKFGGPRSRV
ncbi:hypothetical protein BDZ89DRAFT_1046132 [Hymenopellis radicata]|nr:hypothetical protein BDZ89DRAFT_1046132 [Hymenopellis radicata]